MHFRGTVGTDVDGFPAHAGMDPQTPVSVNGRVAVSPPTRGWTAGSACPPRLRAGFPAHAGMDPWAITQTRKTGRFPRPRGDGPARRGRPACWTTVSPPTRGWTHHLRPLLGHGRVSPPTRGWTPVMKVRRGPQVGFPAHAGMDPSRPVSSKALRGFPRPRGDGPGSRQRTHSQPPVSPPTRGWTSSRTASPLDWRGFPAHAGMDRTPCCRACSGCRFPRPRGDGPASGVCRAYIPKVSPPTRGWTYQPGHRLRDRRGFPAHAGMDPAESASW